MFTVTGTLPDGTPYDVVVDPTGATNRWGVVKSWTPQAAALLYSLEGEHVAAIPTASTVPVDPANAAAILAALYAHTRVLTVTGDAPDVFGELPDGHIA